VVFSVYPHSPNWRKPVGRVFLRIQKWVFWPISSLHWASMRYDAICALFKHPKATRVERFVLPFHWLVMVVVPGLLFGWGTAAIAYVAMSCLSSLMTASVFIPNHIGMRRVASGQKLSYLEQQITTSRNIGNPRVLDFYYGGLNSQIEHHLFPRASHNRYRAMRPVVRAFCEQRGIAYNQTGLFEALASVGRHLGDMTSAYTAAQETEEVPAAPVGA
ncbi:MAG TPA: fatty acid desaturase, partial [Burkholderiaceae bacterium]|nr:fatty acid desaturase [Burkholderiaceae bacterium]